jgi:hypothetical protein
MLLALGAADLLTHLQVAVDSQRTHPEVGATARKRSPGYTHDRVRTVCMSGPVLIVQTLVISACSLTDSDHVVSARCAERRSGVLW